jgi:hypothetical protein
LADAVERGSAQIPPPQKDDSVDIIVTRGEGVIAPGHNFSPAELEMMRQGFLPSGQATAPRMEPIQGTGNSDDTPMSLPKGSFVIPVEARANLEKGRRAEDETAGIPAAPKPMTAMQGRLFAAAGGEIPGADWARSRFLAMVRAMAMRHLEAPQARVYEQHEVEKFAQGGQVALSDGGDPRENRGMELAARAMVTGKPFSHQGQGVFRVPSSTGRGNYSVNATPGMESCECDDFAQGNRCKHLAAVAYQQMYLAEMARMAAIARGETPPPLPKIEEPKFPVATSAGLQAPAGGIADQITGEPRKGGQFITTNPPVVRPEPLEKQGDLLAALPPEFLQSRPEERQPRLFADGGPVGNYADTSPEVSAARRESIRSALETIGDGDMGYAGGWPVRRTGHDTYRVENEREHMTVGAKFLTKWIADRNEQDARLQGARYRVRAAAGWCAGPFAGAEHLRPRWDDSPGPARRAKAVQAGETA